MRDGTSSDQICLWSAVRTRYSLSMSYDAIVVGSGITGGFAAKELTERGLESCTV